MLRRVDRHPLSITARVLLRGARDNANISRENAAELPGSIWGKRAGNRPRRPAVGKGFATDSFGALELGNRDRRERENMPRLLG